MNHWNNWLMILGFLILQRPPAGAATLGAITVRPPAPWKRVMPRGGTPRTQSATWSAPNGKELHLDFWPGLPPQPGGPMVVAEKVRVTVAGETVEMIRTTLFQGRKDEVWAVFLRRGPAWYRLYARRTPRPEFEAILRSVAFEAEKREPR